MTRVLPISAALLATALLLPGCDEPSQAEAARLKKADAKASSGAPAEAKVYTAAGWTPGDDTSWQTQIRGRTQGQNEYSRITATHTSATETAAGATAPASGPVGPASGPAVAKAP